MNKITTNLRFSEDMLRQLQDMRQSQSFETTPSSKSEGKSSFMDHLQEAIQEVNQEQITSDKKATDLANGKDTNIHETMLAATQAELSFNLMVQIRNKALQAYQDIMRMPV